MAVVKETGCVFELTNECSEDGVVGREAGEFSPEKSYLGILFQTALVDPQADKLAAVFTAADVRVMRGADLTPLHGPVRLELRARE